MILIITCRERSSALRAIVVYDINLRFAHRGRGTFLYSCKEKYPKETRPGRCAARKARGTLRSSQAWALRNSQEYETGEPRRSHILSLEQCSRTTPKLAAVLGLLRRGLTSKAVLGFRFAHPEQQHNHGEAQ
jgi:hypothetical protein